MSQWTHPICVDCWFVRNPERVPVQIKEVTTEHCCYCGQMTHAGIYMRDDPENPRHHQLHRDD